MPSILRRSAVVCCLALLVPALAGAQRGCGWNSNAFRGIDRKTYWQNPQMHNTPYDGRLIFARIWYSGYYAYCPASAPYGNEYSVGWAHDFPHPEENVTKMVNALSRIRSVAHGGNIFKFDDPELAKFPIAYLTEPGGWFPNPKEAADARNYLLKGGFLIVDDWRGPDATRNAWAALKAIFPALTPMRVPDSHAIFNAFYQIKNASSLLHNQNRGYEPAEYWGIFEGNDLRGRLMVILDVNEDIKDYWVWSATGRDPIDMSNEAFKLGINYLMYALTH
jgi:hypothetical protein